MQKETVAKILTLTTFGLVGIVLPFFSFPKELKEQAIKDNESHCQGCGRKFHPNQLFAHHILPEQFGGASNYSNLFLVCSYCHNQADWQAISEGKLVNSLTVPDLKNEDPEIIGNRDKYEKAARRFVRDAHALASY